MPVDRKPSTEGKNLPPDQGGKMWVHGKTVEHHWLDLEDPDGWYYASVKWDGCIHLYRCWNEPHSEEERDYYHICDIDYEIERLQALKEEALKHFGRDWR
jgi:hypothetical protein